MDGIRALRRSLNKRNKEQLMRDYVFHVHRRDRLEPDVLAVAVRDDARAEELARQRLSLSELHQAVEVWTRTGQLFRICREDDQST
jgi:hypothetical protein